MSTPAAFGAMSKLVAQTYARQEAEPFREPVDWKAMGLFDYPQIIKKPMDLGHVKAKLDAQKYSSIVEAADDVRLIWKNCMTYNADGSDFYILAQGMSKKFEERFAKLAKEYNLVVGGGGGAGGAGGGGAGGDGAAPGPSSSTPAAPGKPTPNSAEPTLEEKRNFARSLYKITKEELGKVVTELDTKSPEALTKNATEDEVEINVDQILPVVFHDLLAFVKSCSAANKPSSSGSGGGGGGSAGADGSSGGASGGTTKRKKSTSNNKSSKKSRASS